MILYFSGTGNSAFVAKRIASIVRDEVVSINDRIREHSHKKIVSEKPLVFAVPTYGWRIPRLVEEWICKMTFEENQKAYFVMTCGGDIGNAEKYILKLCEKKKFEFMGCAEIVMPENYIAMFPVPEEEEAISIVKKAEPLIEETANAISAGYRLPSKEVSSAGKICSSVVNELFYPLFVKAGKFRATDACISCGKCEKVCPLHNIHLKNGKPVWKRKCTHCMACICDCPREAIEYGKASKGKPRYHCPEV
ncbi:MAG: EFR1 family ferrodoxin [Eubacteriales bacterium]|nr:EFR1 family ferrodoxin [Eubacteriales bacterium]